MHKDILKRIKVEKPKIGKYDYGMGSEYAINVALSSLTSMSLDVVNEENSWIVNHSIDKKRDSILRRLKNRTGFIFSKHGNTSSAGLMRYHRDEINRKYKAYRFNGAKLYPKHFKWGISFKVYNRGFNIHEFKTGDMKLYYEYKFIKKDKEIGLFWSDQPEYHIVGLVAHEFAHIVCNWIKYVGYINRYPRLQAIDETQIKKIYANHDKGWQEIYRKFRRKYINPYVYNIGTDEKPKSIYQEAAKNV